MATSDAELISIVVPAYNEAAGISAFHDSLIAILSKLPNNYEIIYCDDGSQDGTLEKLHQLAAHNPHVTVLRLSRNFGKELAITAGIHAARGQAVITLDADGQHPVDLIPAFIERWRQGSKVVVGVRSENQHQGFLKQLGSRWFYRLFNRLTGLQLTPGSTDFRLIDQTVQREFTRLTEHSRISRGLIDWLGYDQAYIRFNANPRLAGDATYSFKKLSKLAVDSIISHSLSPLYISAYIGAVVVPVSAFLGLGMLLDAVIGDPLHLHATGSAYVVVLLLFLTGILLLSQGIIGLYLSQIHIETKNRPLYVIDRDKSMHLHEA